jgi:hypothetical protein
MRTETLGQRIARRSAGLSGIARIVSNRWHIAVLDRQEALDRGEEPSVELRRQELVAFYNRYEQLVDVICDAAHYGPTSSARGQYQNLRTWISENYDSVQPFLVSYLRADAPADPFIALIAAPELDDLLMQDDGTMICQINQTREALNLYAEHLRQLAARHR